MFFLSYYGSIIHRQMESYMERSLGVGSDGMIQMVFIIFI